MPDFSALIFQDLRYDLPKNARETRSLQLAENLFARNSIEAFSDLNSTGDQVFGVPQDSSWFWHRS